MGIQNRDAAVENGTVMPHIKYMITTGTISSTAGYVLKRRESRVDRCLYSFVHSGVIYIVATQVSISIRKYKSNTVYTYRSVLRLKKEENPNIPQHG